ncbi:acyl-CoA synthetase [Longimycelium tulufanense]|uniref:Acyl-CoA synthetase n=1 Tax=Longimycelium tulufanense TaxID=907463 RepID=A0A8J3CGB4_9PSEU|nr:fatty acyl-AMP ligase [Longimycelium tulufanense]GGM56690.1 acyl-CoA synthetase [Longimycelium tulufanense]
MVFPDTATSSTAATPEPLTTSIAGHATSDTVAFTFIDYTTNRDGVAHSYTWRQLDRRARAVAARLSQVTTRGQRVAVLAPQDLDYVVAFLGALYAGTVAVPLFAPEVSTHGDRLVGALADCDPEVWLTSEQALDTVRQLADGQPVPRPKQIIAVDSVDPALGRDFEPVSVSLDEPAYLQYTSGSTRRPAGAVITHRAVAANVAQARHAYGVDETTTFAGWIPFFHDMGLVLLLALPLAVGAHSVFTTPFAFLRRPMRWLRQLSDYPNVATAAPNFAYEYAAAKVKPEERSTLDLSNVRVACNGSEPVRAGAIEGFLAAFGPHGFAAQAHRPSFGLAEATVFVSTTPAGPPRITSFDREGLGVRRADPVADTARGAVRLVSAGVPVGQHVLIVDPDTGAIRPDNTVGEVWIHGPNVADGYWQQPERSAETFDGRLADGPADLPARGWLRTGDLGVYHDGELYITGRMKDLIIVDGKNHYPHDIEATTQEAHPAIRRDHVAAFAVAEGDAEAVVVVAEHSRHAEPDQLDPAEVARAVRLAVGEHHDLALHDFVLTRPGEVLRTSSGKIARAATRKRYLSGAYRDEEGAR